MPHSGFCIAKSSPFKVNHWYISVSILFKVLPTYYGSYFTIIIAYMRSYSMIFYFVHVMLKAGTELQYLFIVVRDRFIPVNPVF